MIKQKHVTETGAQHDGSYFILKNVLNSKWSKWMKKYWIMCLNKAR